MPREQLSYAQWRERLPNSNFYSEKDYDLLIRALMGEKGENGEDLPPLVFFEPFGAINAALWQIYIQNHAHSTHKLPYIFVAAARPSSEALLLNTTGTYKSRLKTDRVLNVEGDGALLVVHDEIVIKRLRQIAAIQFVNYKIEDLVNIVTEEWLEDLDLDKLPNLVTLIKAFTPVGDDITKEKQPPSHIFEYMRQLFERFAEKKGKPELAQALLDRFCMISGYTSAPLVVQPHYQKHMSVVGGQNEHGVPVCEFLLADRLTTASVVKQEQPDTIVEQHLRQNFKLDFTRTTDFNRSAESEANALKNVLMIRTGFAIADFIAEEMLLKKGQDILEGKVESFINAGHTDNLKKLEYLLKEEQHHNLSYQPPETVKNDFLDCAKIDAQDVIHFIKEIQDVIFSDKTSNAEKIQTLKNIIKKYQNVSGKQPLGSRNCQLGFYLYLATLAEQQGICDDYREIYDIDKEKQEGLQGAKGYVMVLLQRKGSAFHHPLRSVAEILKRRVKNPPSFLKGLLSALESSTALSQTPPKTPVSPLASPVAAPAALEDFDIGSKRPSFAIHPDNPGSSSDAKRQKSSSVPPLGVETTHTHEQGLSDGTSTHLELKPVF